MLILAPRRRAMLNPADDAFAARLARDLPPGTIGATEDRHLEDPRGRVRGVPGVLARPRTTDEVARIVRACAAARVGLVPRGGGTGLVLGQIVPEGPPAVILSLERMNRVRGLWPEEGVVIAEAGAILADVQAAAREAGRLFPLTLASQGSAQIGGLLSTNAGGVNVLRYGNARDLCLGVEAVLPDGSVLHGLKRLRKDNSGYDLRNLLVGAEGTLGVITAAALRLCPIPPATGTAMLTVPSAQAALTLLWLAQGLLFLDEMLPEVRQPFAVRPEWLVLIEVGLPEGIDAEAALAGLFEDAAAQGLAEDGVIAQSAAQAADFWHLREAIPEANRRIGAVSPHDISLPLSEIPAFLARAPEVVARFGDYRINVFGHLGDGNLHYNVFPPKGEAPGPHRARAAEIQRAVHDLAVSMGGSFSAEHGVGRLKVGDLERYADPARLAAMRAVKRALDPFGIMNPGAVLRAGG
jgi:FAD/FMN-containing dehydrogenase